MATYFTVLSVAGSDSSGGAGIQADLKTFSALGCYGMTAITALTAQNTTGVTAIHVVPPEFVEAQIDVVFDDIVPNAVKIGMLGSGDVAEAVGEALRRNHASHIVLDPVVVATSGATLSGADAFAPLKDKLFPISEVITPNLAEARTLSNIFSATPEVADPSEARAIARALQAQGANAVLITGVRTSANPSAISDLLYFNDSGDCLKFDADEIVTQNTHGTGCTLSSAIAAYLASGHPLDEAVAHAHHYVHEAITHGASTVIGRGHGPVNHFFDPKKLIII